MDENNGNLHSLGTLRSMEVIDINTGTRLGYIKDIIIDIQAKKVESLIMPLTPKKMFSKGEDYELPWEKVVKAGVDVILIEGGDLIEKMSRNNI